MKLKIRGFGSPNHCFNINIHDRSSVGELRNAVDWLIPLPPRYSLRLSIGDVSSSPEDSLSSAGVYAGDTIVVWVVPNEASTSERGCSVPPDKVRSRGSGIEHCFVETLVRVLREGFVGSGGFWYKMIVSGVHSVFLESGFVGLFGGFLDSGKKSQSLYYSLCSRKGSSRNGLGWVVLKFQVMRNFVVVYGYLNCDVGPATRVYRVCLDGRRFGPRIAAIRSSNFEDMEIYRGEMFELWRAVKDGLASPLEIDLCERAGITGPACFAGLPSEVQMKIMKHLPSSDVVRVGSTSKDLHRVSLSGDLWGMKLEKEFGPEKIWWRSSEGCRGYFMRTAETSRRKKASLRKFDVKKKVKEFERKLKVCREEDRLLWNHYAQQASYQNQWNKVYVQRFRLMAMYMGFDVEGFLPLPPPAPPAPATALLEFAGSLRKIRQEVYEESEDEEDEDSDDHEDSEDEFDEVEEEDSEFEEDEEEESEPEDDNEEESEDEDDEEQPDNDVEMEDLRGQLEQERAERLHQAEQQKTLKVRLEQLQVQSDRVQERFKDLLKLIKHLLKFLYEKYPDMPRFESIGGSELFAQVDQPMEG